VIWITQYVIRITYYLSDLTYNRTNLKPLPHAIFIEGSNRFPVFFNLARLRANKGKTLGSRVTGVTSTGITIGRAAREYQGIYVLLE
jgi:hypothetical protein